MQRLRVTYAIILACIFFGVVFHAPLSVAFGTLLPDYQLIIKAWKELLLIGLVPVAAYMLSAHQIVLKRFARDNLMRAIAAYGALHVLLVLLLGGDADVVLAGLAIDLRYILFFGLVAVAGALLPIARSWFLRVGLAAAVISLGFAVLQVFVLPADVLSLIGYGDNTIQPFLTVDQNSNYIRINSTLRGPNPLGAYGVIVLSLATTYMLAHKNTRRRAWAGVLAVAAAIAIWFSYSRSALGGAVVSVGLIATGVLTQFFKKRTIIIGCALIAILLGLGYSTIRDNSAVSTIILHEDPAEPGEVNSNDGHFESLKTGTVRVAQQPLGSGIGSTGSASLLGDKPFVLENQYLFVAHESGWPGLGLFVYIYTLIMLRLWRQRADWLAYGVFASGIGLGLIGLLQPVWADDTVSIVWFGLAAVALYSQGLPKMHISTQKLRSDGST